MKKQKSILMLMFGLMVMFGMTSCSMEDVPEGHKGILVKRPILFGSSGVEILNADRHTIASSSTLVLVNVQPSIIKETFNDLTPKDDTPVDFDITFNFLPDETKLDILYTKFGLNFYETILKSEFRELVRKKSRLYDMKTLCNGDNVAEEITEYVKTEGNKIIKKYGIPVTLTAVNMGSVNPPEAVKKERERTAEAKQREQTIEQETKNEKERQNKERERAIADKTYQESLGLTKTEYLFLQELRVKEIGYAKASEITIIEGGSPNVNKTVR